MSDERESPVTVVVPGDAIELAKGQKPGAYTFTRGDSVVAARLGVLRPHGEYLDVVPMSGVYNPVPGDVIIGIVTDVGPGNWMVDINSPYPAPMHSSETPWDVEFGEAGQFLRAGDAILCKILFVDESRRVQVTMKDINLTKLNGGQILSVDPAKVARVIGRKGSMVDTIKRFTDVWMYVGQNGRVWINGEMPMILAAIDAIRMIESETQTQGLTERVEAFLQKTTGRTGEPTAEAQAEAN